MRPHVAAALFGLVLGVVISGAGFSDWGEIHRMFSFADLRLVLAFAGALVLSMIGFRVLAHADELPSKPIRAGTVPGAILFGAGWALSGACPGAVLVQLGEGKLGAVVSLAGILAGARLHDVLRKRLGWARHSCID